MTFLFLLLLGLRPVAELHDDDDDDDDDDDPCVEDMKLETCFSCFSNTLVFIFNLFFYILNLRWNVQDNAGQASLVILRRD